jgi:L-fuconolactonase
MIVDSHAHASTHWFEPIEVLLFQMDRNGVERVVLVQLRSEFDNTYLLECAKRYPDRVSVVVGIDTRGADALGELERISDRGAAGVRLRPPAGGEGDELLPLWRSAAQRGLAVSALGTPAEFSGPGFLGMLASTPGLRVALEHLGTHPQLGPALTPGTAGPLYAAIAPFPAVLVKFHGLGETNPRAEPRVGAPFSDPTPHVLLRALAVLGAGRLMWGSDYPPSSAREGYANTLRLPLEALRAAGIPAGDESRLFGGNAAALFARR